MAEISSSSSTAIEQEPITSARHWSEIRLADFHLQEWSTQNDDNAPEVQPEVVAAAVATHDDGFRTDPLNVLGEVDIRALAAGGPTVQDTSVPRRRSIARRVRNRFRRSSTKREEKLVTPVESEESSFDAVPVKQVDLLSPDFVPRVYLERAHKNTSLLQLRRGLRRLDLILVNEKNDAESIDTALQDQLADVLQCRNAIAETVEEIPEQQKALHQVNAVAKDMLARAQELHSSLADSRKQRAHLDAILHLRNKYGSVIALPAMLEEQLKSEDVDGVTRTVDSFLSLAWPENDKTLQKVRECFVRQCSEGVARVQGAVCQQPWRLHESAHSLRLVSVLRSVCSDGASAIESTDTRDSSDSSGFKNQEHVYEWILALAHSTVATLDRYYLDHVNKVDRGAVASVDSNSSSDSVHMRVTSHNRTVTSSGTTTSCSSTNEVKPSISTDQAHARVLQEALRRFSLMARLAFRNTDCNGRRVLPDSDFRLAWRRALSEVAIAWCQVASALFLDERTEETKKKAMRRMVAHGSLYVTEVTDTVTRLIAAITASDQPLEHVTEHVHRLFDYTEWDSWFDHTSPLEEIRTVLCSVLSSVLRRQHSELQRELPQLDVLSRQQLRTLRVTRNAARHMAVAIERCVKRHTTQRVNPLSWRPGLLTRVCDDEWVLRNVHAPRHKAWHTVVRIVHSLAFDEGAARGESARLLVLIACVTSLRDRIDRQDHSSSLDDDDDEEDEETERTVVYADGLRSQAARRLLQHYQRELCDTLLTLEDVVFAHFIRARSGEFAEIVSRGLAHTDGLWLQGMQELCPMAVPLASLCSCVPCI
ncbi:MAG: hypothetical protein MHM6MM_000324 [Cercozoa sp. M6MM]